MDAEAIIAYRQQRQADLDELLGKALAEEPKFARWYDSGYEYARHGRDILVKNGLIMQRVVKAGFKAAIKDGYRDAE